MPAIFDALSAGRDLSTPQADSPGPFCLADPDVVTTILHGAGFVDEQLLPLTESMCGADADDAWAFISQMDLVRGLTNGPANEVMTRTMSRLRTAVIEHETDNGVLFGSAAWLITAGQAFGAGRREGLRDGFLRRRTTYSDAEGPAERRGEPRGRRQWS